MTLLSQEGLNITKGEDAQSRPVGYMRVTLNMRAAGSADHHVSFELPGSQVAPFPILFLHRPLIIWTCSYLYVWPRMTLFWLHVCLLLCIYLFMAVLGLCCCSWAFSSCRERDRCSSCDVRASHCSGFSCCGEQPRAAWASVVVAHGFSCPVSHGIFPDQGSNPCPLHWQAHP